MTLAHLENPKCITVENCVDIQDFSTSRVKSVNAWTVKKEPATKLEVCLLIAVVVLAMCHVQLRYQVSHLERLLLSREDGPSGAPYTNVAFREYETSAGREREQDKKLQERGIYVGRDANFRDTTRMTEKTMIKLSRHARETTNNNKCNMKVGLQDILKNYCNSLEKKEIPVKEPDPVRLQYDSYYTDFYSMFPKEHIFGIKGNSWPSELKGRENVTVSKHNAINFHRQGSPLGIYMNSVNNSLLETTDKYSGKFFVRTKGVYILSLNITLEDETANHSIGITLNTRMVLACPPGGFKCPTNHPTSDEYRVCNINGILQLAIGDVLEIKTMAPNTVINLQNERKSVFVVVLLADI